LELWELPDQVASKRDLIDFILALKADREDELRKEAEHPSSPWAAGANGWQNGSIEMFLDAMAAWAEGTSALTGEPMVSEEPSWRDFARILYMGKTYE
jgi:hypothetical protein